MSSNTHTTDNGRRTGANGFSGTPDPRIVRADGFLQEPARLLVIDMLAQIRTPGVQEYVNFGKACTYCRVLDKMLLAVKRPRQWGMLDDSTPLPEGYVRITPEISRSLTCKCDTMARQAFLKFVTIETLVEFCEMLRIVLQPMVEAFLLGTLQLTERLPKETVTLLSRDHRAALVTEFRKMLALVKKEEQTVESFIDLYTAIDIALESVRRPSRPIAPYRPSLHERRGSKRCLWLMPEHLELLIKGLNEKTLSLNALSGFGRSLKGAVAYPSH